MNIAGIVAMFALFGVATATEAGDRLSGNDLEEVITLIKELRDKIESDGKMEQKSYDKYACWCEQTIERKAKEIEEAKNKIEELTNLIIKLKGELAAHNAEIKQQQKDVNAASSSVATSRTVRNKEAAEYKADKLELEQCIGALEAAINILSPPPGKKSFLGTLQEAQLLSAASGVKGILGMDLVTSTFTAAQIQAVREFAHNPDSYVRPRDATGLLQVGASAERTGNPFGDYGGESGQIQGILKGMYDSFATALEKANGKEASSQSSFEELMATKQKELDTLKVALQKEMGLFAEKSSLMAESKQLLLDTKAQLKADEKLFAEITKSCREKARQWAQRSHFRSEELAGIEKGIKILEDGTDKFAKAKESFLQVSMKSSAVQRVVPQSNDVFMRLNGMAAKYHSLSLAHVAAAARTGGHFDKIITMIDKEIASMRKEEASDIYHKDRCEAGTTKNENDHEDLVTAISKLEAELEHFTDDEKRIEEDIKEVEDEVKAAKKEVKERLELRNEEEADFKQSLRDDQAAVDVIAKGIEALTAFYKANKLPLELVQEDPEYTVDKDKAPETSFDSGNYGGSGQTGGIISILSMLKEDLEMEMKTAKKDDAEAEEKYETDMRALKTTLSAAETKKVTLEGVLSELKSKISDLEDIVNQKKSEKKENEDMAEALSVDCKWVELTFDKRMKSRNEEMDGLMEAKNILGGAGSGESLLAASANLDLITIEWDKENK